MNSNFPITTVPSKRCLVAEEMGFVEEYRDKVLQAMWEDDINLGDQEILMNFVQEFDIDHDIFLMRFSEDIKQQLFDNTNMAVERGSFGVPTFFVNDQIFFGKDKLVEIEEYLLTLK